MNKKAPYPIITIIVENDKQKNDILRVLEEGEINGDLDFAFEVGQLITETKDTITFGSEWCIGDVKHLFKEEISHMNDDEIYDELSRVAKAYNDHAHCDDIWGIFADCFEIKPKEKEQK
jgi:hypothetical protein